jgi:hypothetical protein
MATTTNFGWETPDDTDLVKDGALAMRTLGNAIDASLVDLKGGTTGQVLSKTSDTDMDFTWVTSDDADAIQNSIVDAKGDLIAASAADTPARLAVGSDGDTLVADSAATTGLSWQGNFAAGKNKIINGDFSIWQRGTSFTVNGYGPDRFIVEINGTGTFTATRESFTPGTAPVSGYESPYYLKWICNTLGTSTVGNIRQRIEDVRTFAGQTVTLSFWAKADSTRNLEAFYGQEFGSGGSALVESSVGTFNLTTSWTRYSVTFTLPSISGKTIGSNNYLMIRTKLNSMAAGYTVETWGWQIEAGSVATPFTTATGTIQGELAACQRYYWRSTAPQIASRMPAGSGITTSTTNAFITIICPVQMRTAPTSIDVANLVVYEGTGDLGVTNAVLTGNCTGTNAFLITATFSGGTANRPALLSVSAIGGYIGASAEL